MAHTSGTVPVGQEWVFAELGDVELGDARRSRRLLSMVGQLAATPEASFRTAMGSPKAIKAGYKFLENEAVLVEQVQKAHREQTLARADGLPLVLAIADTTVLNYTRRRSTQGLGPIGDGGRGLFVHSTLLITPQGEPLGILGWEAWARSDEGVDHGIINRSVVPIEKKESMRWVNSVRLSCLAASKDTRVLNLMDREGDIYDVFMEAKKTGTDLLVRCKQNRRLKTNEPRYLWDAEDQSQVSGVLDVLLPRQEKRPERQARLEIRYSRVLIQAPVDRPKNLPAYEATIIFAREVDAPAGQEPIHWRLVTTMEVETFEQASYIVHLYTLRWRIETYHFVLKSGCRIERLQLEDADNIERALGLYAVTAWRQLHLTHAARTRPGAPATECFTPTEMIALDLAHGRDPDKPKAPLTLREAVREIAKLGGFQARKADGEPGVQTVWRGLRVLIERAKGYEDAVRYLTRKK